MKNFIKLVVANIVAIILVFMGIFLCILFLMIAGSFSNDSNVKLKNNSILTLDFKTNIIDSPTEDINPYIFSKDKKKNVMLFDVLDAINHAKNDNNIKGISIETDNLGAGLTQLDDIRAALEDFKKSGKFVYAYGNSVSQAAYYLGSVADQYYLHPAGGIELKGMAAEIVFFKKFLDKYGIGMEVIRHGKYKAAVEPFLRDDISPENKEQMSVLLNDIWGNISQKIGASRKIDALQFKTTVDSLYGIIPDLALKSKLADKLLQKGEYDDILKSKLKLGKEDDLNKISFTDYLSTYNTTTTSDKEVAVLYASGSINNGEGYEDIYSKDYIKYIRKIADDDNIKAVVFRVNSPGGSANASDEILFELQELKKKKPLIVSFGDYAASGGFYISMGADKIFSEPNTLTGSIGVFGVIPNYKELANRNGIRSDIVETNTNSSMYSPLNGLTKGSEFMITKSVEQTYKRFVYFVTQNRKKTFEQIDEIGGGRVWSGVRAKQLGLVDELGTLQDAISYAAKLAKISDNYSIESFPKKKTPFELLFDNLDGEELSTQFLKSKLGEEKFKMFQMVVDPKLQNGVIMELPYRIAF